MPMLNEYYRPRNELLASLSLVLISSTAVLSHAHSPIVLPAPAPYIAASPDYLNLNGAFYVPAVRISEEVQVEMLEGFAKKLLSNLVEPPQAASKLLNERFWDLV